MKKLLSMLMVLAPLALHAQDKVWVSLTPVDMKFYCGIVNEASFPIHDFSKPFRNARFEAVPLGAKIDYDVQGRMSVLPEKPQFSIDVYAVISGHIYWVDKIEATCINPPVNDGDFKAEVPYPQRALKKQKYFSIEGKSVKQDSTLIVSYAGGMPDFIGINKVRVALRISVPKGDEAVEYPWWECVMQSDDAEITRLHNQVYAIVPKPGVKKIRMRYLVNGKSILEEEYKVRPK